VTREEAIKKLKLKPYDPIEIETDMKYIAKKLAVTDKELDEILKLPAKWYWNYPNAKRKLEFIYDTYRAIFRKEKLDRF
jgi:hypothetical protein